jgi:hypothetical protein
MGREVDTEGLERRKKEFKAWFNPKDPTDDQLSQ